MDATQAVQKFRSKYPGAYDKYNDAELLSALQKKYPGAYNHLTVKQEVQPSENILQRASKVVQSAMSAGMQNMSPLGVQANPKFPFFPTMPTDSSAMSAGMSEANMPITKGNQTADIGIGLASGLLAGGKLSAGAVGKKVGAGVANLKNPSKVFSEKISGMKGKVDFFKVINDALDDPDAAKILKKSGVIKKYGGSTVDEAGAMTDKLSNLSPQDSQNILNRVKDSVTLTVRKGNVSSSQLGIQKLITGMSKAQESALEGIKEAKHSYGFAKEFGKGLKKYGKKALSGASWTGGAGLVGYPIAKAIHRGSQ